MVNYLLKQRYNPTITPCGFTEEVCEAQHMRIFFPGFNGVTKR